MELLSGSFLRLSVSWISNFLLTGSVSDRACWRCIISFVSCERLVYDDVLVSWAALVPHRCCNHSKGFHASAILFLDVLSRGLAALLRGLETIAVTIFVRGKVPLESILTSGFSYFELVILDSCCELLGLLQRVCKVIHIPCVGKSIVGAGLIRRHHPLIGLYQLSDISFGATRPFFFVVFRSHFFKFCWKYTEK